MLNNKWFVGMGLAVIALIVASLMLRSGPDDCRLEIVGARTERVCE